MLLEPVPNEPAATADLGDERALVVADYHAGIETALRYDGVEVDSRAETRRDRLRSLVERIGASRVVVVGDLAHDIGRPAGEEREELAALLDALSVPLTLVRGNHDGEIGEAVDIDVTDGAGVRMGDIGFAHGHTWPGEAALSGEVLCVGHEHPAVRIEDSVGGSRIERVWLRGELDPEAFDGPVSPSEIVVFPAYNDLSGGTWVNTAGQEFLSPFLPEALADAQAYLLDGTRLGDYETV